MLTIRFNVNLLLLITAAGLGFLCFPLLLLKQRRNVIVRNVRYEDSHTTSKCRAGSTVISDSFNLAESRIQSRVKTMEHACIEHGLNNSVSSEMAYIRNPYLKTSIFYSDKYKLILCDIPKCASTNMAKFLATIEGLINVTDPSKVPGGQAASMVQKYRSARRIFNIEEIAKRLETYSKFVLVREPLSRLLSAFRNKLENNNRGEGYAKLAQRIQKKYGRENSSVSFNDYIRYLTDTKAKAQRDQHWNFYNVLCWPCDIKYDFVVHMDTLDDDMNYVMKKLGISGIPFPPSYNSFTDRKKVEKYYSEATPELANVLYHTYKLDYDLFGYSPPPQF